METPVSFNELPSTIRMEFWSYLRNTAVSSGCYEDCTRLGIALPSLVQVRHVVYDYLFDEAMTETTLAFQVIGYDDVFCWTRKEKEECPF